jgi:hypothetical protein
MAFGSCRSTTVCSQCDDALTAWCWLCPTHHLALPIRPCLTSLNPADLVQTSLKSVTSLEHFFPGGGMARRA